MKLGLYGIKETYISIGCTFVLQGQQVDSSKCYKSLELLAFRMYYFMAHSLNMLVEEEKGLSWGYHLITLNLRAVGTPYFCLQSGIKE